MTRVVILNFVKTFVEIVDVPDKYIELLDDGKISDEGILIELGYDVDNIQFMFVDGDIPVYKNRNNSVSFYL